MVEYHDLTDDENEIVKAAQDAVRSFHGKDLEDLIAALEKVLLAYKVDKRHGYHNALVAVIEYLGAEGVSDELLNPLINLLLEIAPKMPGGNKPLNEAHIMAMAAAAVTHGSPDGTAKQVDAACKHVAKEMEKAGFRHTKAGVKWGWKSLKEHRNELIYERASAWGIASYEHWSLTELQAKTKGFFTPEHWMDFVLSNVIDYMGGQKR